MSVTVVVCIKNKQNKYKMKLSKTLKTRIDDFFNNLTNEELEYLEESYFNKRLKTITVTHCCTELNHNFSIGDDAWLVEKKIVEINNFCATPDRIEIIDDGKYRLVDIGQLNKVV